jgi:diguanylate cyclase (GGDEF)-like protein
MTIENRERIRILIADDESEVLETYRKILIPPDRSSGADRFSELRARLYEDKAAGPVRHKPKTFKGNFDAEFCDGAEAAVEAVRKSLATGMPFAIAFLDMRMPPGPDGVWAAMRIRELDPAIEIVICTAYSDVDAGDIADLVQPEEKLSYVQKPFHPNEIRQMALSLASKWRAEHRIIKLAYFDTLTGLPNREQARNRLTSAIATAAARGKSLSVLYLDLDNFKRVNDTLGHGVGDELLRVAASRLLGSLRAGDMVCADGPARAGLPGHVFRLGGDEFIVLLANIDSPDEVSTVAARLIEDLQKPIQLGLHTVVVTPSVGIAVYPRDGQDVDTLMRHADLAMYVAKRGAPGRFRYPCGGDIGYGGAAALDQRGARFGPAVSVHPGGRGKRLDPRDWRVGAAHRLPAGQDVAGSRPAGGAHGRQCLGFAIRAQRLPLAGGGDHPDDRHRSVDAGTRNHRVGGHDGRGSLGKDVRSIEGAGGVARHR